MILTVGVAQSGFYDKADRFFSKYVQNGQVNYKAVKNSPSTINQIVDHISTYDLSGKTAAQKKAFLINAYNLLIIKTVVDRYPISSPMKVDGFFDKIDYTVAGRSVTLNELEKKWLYADYPDPRLHFVLVCAAEGCPEIVSYAYKPGKLDAQLTQKTKNTLNDPGFIRVRSGENKVFVSEIFKWYKSHFTAEGQSVLEYINSYRESNIPASYKVGYYEYDWLLNDTKKNR
jgi:hypothetical protein